MQYNYEALSKKLDIYEKIISSAKDLISSLDKELRITTINRTQLERLGLSRDEVLGKKLTDIITKDEFEQKLQSHINKCLDGECVKFCDWFNIKSGSYYFEVNCIPTYSESKEIDGMIIIAHDMTEDKKREDELKKLAERLEEKVESKVVELREKDQLMLNQNKFAAMGEMLSMIAHQWRQPLNAISVASINLKFFSEMGTLTEDMLKLECDFIENQAQQMSQTINDFMGFFRPDRDKKPFLLSECIKKVNDIMEAQLRHHSIGLKVDIDSEVWLNGVKNEMEHILLNLLSNARDAMKERNSREKFIYIAAKENSDSICIKVGDNGGGIPEDIIGRVFEPYFTTKEDGKGTGIGLYITKTITERRFGGTINVQNTNDGAEFIIHLPKR